MDWRERERALLRGSDWAHLGRLRGLLGVAQGGLLPDVRRRGTEATWLLRQWRRANPAPAPVGALER